MTRTQAGEEAIKLHAEVRDWRDERAWSTALQTRYFELMAFATGTSNHVPDSQWSLESLSHLDGAPKPERR